MIDWIQTYLGKKFYPLNPLVADIEIEDIAHALSNQCRWSGHVNRFLSVGQHSVMVSNLCDRADALWGLLHDASEAYLVDLPTPIKKLMPEYQRAEENVMRAICTRFRLPPTMPESVRVADAVMMATEAHRLMAPVHPDFRLPEKPIPDKLFPWTQEYAKKKFLERFYDLERR